MENNKKKKTIIGIVIAVVVIAGAVTGGYFFLNKKNITEAEAKEIVLSDAGVKMEDTQVMTVNYDSDDNEYNIEFTSNNLSKKFDYTVNARNGKITDKEEESIFINSNSSTQAPTDNTNVQNTSIITLDKAKEIALSKAGFNANEVTFVQAELDADDNRYDIEFIGTDKNTSSQMKYDYEINALDGTVISAQTDKDLS